MQIDKDEGIYKITKYLNILMCKNAEHVENASFFIKI